MDIRSLKHKDTYRLSKILKKMGLRDEVKKLYTDVTDKSDEEKAKVLKDLQKEIIMLLLENYHMAEEEINFFLGDLVGLKPEEFAELDFNESGKIIKQLLESDGVIDFFKQAVQ